jgi:hypothetical protein
MKQSFKISLLLSVITFSDISLAAKNGFYGDLALGLGFGPSNTNVKSQYFVNSGGTLSANPSDVYTLTTRGVPAGYINLGYNFIPYFGIEADVTEWGKQDLSSFANNITPEAGLWSGKLDTYSYGLNAVGYLPLLESHFNVFAKLGIAMVHSNIEVNDPTGALFFNPGSYQANATELGLVYGVGALYQFTNYIAGELEWKGVNRFNDNRISNIHYNLVSVGLRFTSC